MTHPPSSSLHGRIVRTPDPSRALEAHRRASELVSDEGLGRLLATPRDPRPVARSREVFVNRNLRLANVELVGFDMDYTLAIYHQRRIEELSFDLTVARLISVCGYPMEIGQIPYDHHFVMRGLAVDKANGNLIKMDRFGHVGRAFHGLRRLDREAFRGLYRQDRVRPKELQYAWIDTLFALPEAWLYAAIIELLEGRGRAVDYGKLYDDIREAIDAVHRDNSLKRELRKDLGRYIFRDPELGPALHKLRSGGKKLFLLTNSLWDYTDAVMRHLLEGQLPEYSSWRNYFDYVVTAASKPDFFSAGRPFQELDPASEAPTVIGEPSTMERGRVYQGGNLSDFQRMTGYSADRVLYVGDHIYGDILKSKKSSLWRTCMIVQEIEDEIDYTASRQEEIARLSEVELTRARVDDEVNLRKGLLNSAERRLERMARDDAGRPELEEERRRLKTELERLRRAMREADELAQVLEQDVEEGFNPHWGLMFKEGNENSRFGQQVEQYACLYTSRVSNFLFHSPMHYFRSPRNLMPHEQAGAMSAKLSPIGGEGPPAGED